jgi:hypothetical protein
MANKYASKMGRTGLGTDWGGGKGFELGGENYGRTLEFPILVTHHTRKGILGGKYLGMEIKGIGCQRKYVRNCDRKNVMLLLSVKLYSKRNKQLYYYCSG